ncbi:hypothetical protein [Kitasatospora sp. NPDC094015]|uniref:hypothetical protein n=1 Tax=Kitasatospora sp. NPDC094015 TaxID=3155205 RepID=UPI00331C0EEA
MFGTSDGAGSKASFGREPSTAPEVQPASVRTARVGGRSTVTSSRPDTAVERRRVRTRVA